MKTVAELNAIKQKRGELFGTGMHHILVCGGTGCTSGKSMNIIKALNEQIAEKLKIKINTLENYVSIIYDKLGCKDRASLLEKIR